MIFEDSHYESQEATPTVRILRYIKKTHFKNMRLFCSALIKFEVRKMFSSAKVAATQFGINTKRYPDNDEKYYKASICHALNLLTGGDWDFDEGMLVNLSKEQPGPAQLIKKEKVTGGHYKLLFSILDKEEVEAALANEEIHPTTDEIENVYNTVRGHIGLDRTSHKYIMYKDFITAPIERGGMGYSWHWVVNGGKIEHATTKGQGSLVLKTKLEAEAAVKENEEKLAKMLGMAEWKHKAQLLELNENLTKHLEMLQEMARKHGIQDTPEITKLKKHLEKTKSELVKT